MVKNSKNLSTKLCNSKKYYSKELFAKFFAENNSPGNRSGWLSTIKISYINESKTLVINFKRISNNWHNLNKTWSLLTRCIPFFTLVYCFVCVAFSIVTPYSLPYEEVTILEATSKPQKYIYFSVKKPFSILIITTSYFRAVLEIIQQ